ncbi:HAMP domain-containing protein [Elioraea sp. Yellowstone]|jgi:two-component system osmolarity sensor histidine kinase EnvZ|uniref:ATP-binding protein n=1 Tax=Elioraea sp. Yellowstone TaxID=2592070 RepID=UPI0011504300|nr:ATP-binding protein [Elioraea sp. Yellowstone]TQF78117.1 HAMP domain-containing protein [Elioraea sp. Yellowstone]
MRRLAFAIKRMLPRSLFGRSVLIIVMPLILLQAVALQIFYGTHWEVISRRLAAAVAGDVGLAVETLRRFPAEADQDWLAAQMLIRADLAIRFAEGEILPTDPPDVIEGPAETELRAALAERVRLPFRIDWSGRTDREVQIRVQLPEGVLHVEAPAKRLFTGTVTVFVLWLIGSALLLFAIAAIFMRNQVKPVRRLAVAADAFGKGLDVGPIKPEGADEVRQAAAAFNLMQERLRRFLAQRTAMLAGVSHDLRTPLTRMRLALAMLARRNPEEAEEVAAIGEDIAEMERMIEGYLAFARGEGTEQARPTDLGALLAEMAEKARAAGTEVEVSAPAPLVLPLRADAMRRCLGNLIDNARRHAGHVWLAAERVMRGGGEAVQITVDDDGPGIPAERREEAFRPFVRLDGGRGGSSRTGLGLTIARDIVRAHGGEIALEESPRGGLRARIRLPA